MTVQQSVAIVVSVLMYQYEYICNI